VPEVISDTSPIQYLYQINLLDLLPALYQRVIIPQAVCDELEAGRAHKVQLPDISVLSWIEIRQVIATPQIIFPVELGLGEKEVLTLATQITNPLALLDDALARQHAQILNLAFTGILGVLLKAKREGHLKALEPILTQLESLRFRLGAKTHEAVLNLAGE
jgi:predicted nucleic acid-binding protein